MINELVVATHNQGKVEEFKVLMKDLPIEIKYLADFDAVEAPAETGRTFAANARQKATYYAKKLGKPASPMIPAWRFRRWTVLPVCAVRAMPAKRPATRTTTTCCCTT